MYLPQRAPFAPGDGDPVEPLRLGEFDQPARGVLAEFYNFRLEVCPGEVVAGAGSQPLALSRVAEDRHCEFVTGSCGALDSAVERLGGRLAGAESEQDVHTRSSTGRHKKAGDTLFLCGVPEASMTDESGTDDAEPAPDDVRTQAVRPADDPDADADAGDGGDRSPGVPEDVRTYDRFTKIEGSTYDRANEFLRERTYITAREWAIARLCADFRTETGVEMTKIGEHLPDLVPFMTDTYSPQAVNQARASFEEKVRTSGATFLYGAMCDFFTAEKLDDVMYEATEVAKFFLEVEGVDLPVEEELAAEERVTEVMKDVRRHSAAIRHDEVTCPDCGHQFEAGGGSGGE